MHLKGCSTGSWSRRLSSATELTKLQKWHEKNSSKGFFIQRVQRVPVVGQITISYRKSAIMGNFQLKTHFKLFFFVAILCLADAQFNDISDVASIYKIGQEVFSVISHSWEKLGSSSLDPEEEPSPGFFLKGSSSHLQRQLLNRISSISRKTESFENCVQSSLSEIGNLAREMPSRLRWELRLDTLANAIRQVLAAEKSMITYSKVAEIWTKRGVELETSTLEDFATSTVSHGSHSVRTLLESIHSMVVPREITLGRGIFDLLLDTLQDGGSGLCSIHQSPKQLIYNLYNMVTLTEIKGYAMMQFSWMLLKLYNKGNFTLEAELMRDRVEARMDEKIKAAQKSMAKASPEFWICDPNHHEENETYVQLTKLLQGQVVNEVDLNAKSSCRDNCAYYSYARVHGCYQGLCNKQPKCTGRLFDCRFIDSDSNVCLSNSANRKYDWIEYENGRTLGKKASCSRGSTKIDSWWRWLFWHCSYCFCMCDEQGPKSDRYFSLHASLAKEVENEGTNSNRGVTGLRFVKVNRVIHLQIQDGVVLPGGMINSSTLEWRPIKPFKPSDPDIIRGEDFHMMTWEQRAIDLDDLIAPEGSVLTGVKLRIIGSHLNLEILATPINITTGYLATSSSLWVGNDNTPAARVEPRKELKLPSPDVPTRCPAKSSKQSHSDQYLKFTNSDIDTDVAQTTVPFIDTQSVVPNPPSLLVGAGIFHKGRRNCGGFVAPKVITYDYSQHLILSN